MIIRSNLIHSGLPWTSPQKIAISASLYISNAVINRSLLHLLNNDYYLDIKSLAINKYIELKLATHIIDETVHVTEERLNKILSSFNSLTSDDVYYIPIQYYDCKISVSTINKIISSIPKNLNGHTLVLYFCIACTPEKLNEYDDFIDLGNRCINIENFINGDLIIYSNITAAKNFNYTNSSNSLETNTNINLEGTININNFKAKSTDVKEIFEEIQKIIDKKVLKKDDITSKAITFKGTGINLNYSVISVRNCLANVYIINTIIKNTLTNWNEINEIKEKIGTFPSNSDILLYYKCNNVYYNFLDKKIPCDSLTYNELYLKLDSSAYNLNLISDKEIKNSSSDNIMYINSDEYLTGTEINTPQYFTLLNNTDYDDDYKSSNINTLRNLLYNIDVDKKTNCTLMFTGKLYENMNYNNCPIFVDYNNIGQEQGLYIYLNKIFCTNSTDDIDININIDKSLYVTDFNTYFSDICTTLGIFVILFIHEIDKYVSANTLLTAINEIPLDKNNMRINVLFYPINTNFDKNDYKTYILSPTDATIKKINSTTNDVDKHNILTKFNYLFKKPTSGIYSLEDIKLFANKRLTSTSGSIRDWDFYSGGIKNIFLFNRILKPSEIRSFVRLLLNANTNYNWYTDIEKAKIENINLSSFIGTVYSLNNKNFNIIKTIIQ